VAKVLAVTGLSCCMKKIGASKGTPIGIAQSLNWLWAGQPGLDSRLGGIFLISTTSSIQPVRCLVESMGFFLLNYRPNSVADLPAIHSDEVYVHRKSKGKAVPVL
jgi:hypothetical protein